MLEKYLSVQDMLLVLGVLFAAVKWLQRKEGWGWKKIKW